MNNNFFLQNDGWHELQRVKSGFIQLHFKVLSEDIAPQVRKFDLPTINIKFIFYS